MSGRDNGQSELVTDGRSNIGVIQTTVSEIVTEPEHIGTVMMAIGDGMR